VAEPVVYMMDRYVVGGFYRVHAERGIDEDLSAPGSSYVPLALAAAPNCRSWVCDRGPASPTGFICMVWWAVWPCWLPVTSWKPLIRKPNWTLDSCAVEGALSLWRPMLLRRSIFWGIFAHPAVFRRGEGTMALPH